MSNSMVWNGKYAMVKQPSRQSWRPREGFTSVWMWKGPKKLAFGLAADLRAALVPYELVESYVTTTVTATFGADPSQSNGGTEDPVSIWSCQPNRVEKSIYENRYLILELSFSGSASANIAALRSCVQDKEFRLEDFDLSVSDAAEAWFDVIMKGLESFLVEQPVLTWTRVVSTGYNITTLANAAKANVGAILSLAQMAAEGAPAYMLDDFSAGKPAGTTYGYRKARPSIEQIAGGKVQLVNQYESGLWVTDANTPLYFAAT